MENKRNKKDKINEKMTPEELKKMKEWLTKFMEKSEKAWQTEK